MAGEPITVEQMDELLRFLPLFDVPERAFVVEWKAPSGQFPFPIYTEDVTAFFWLAGRPPWADYQYHPGKSQRLLADETIVQRASLDELRSMLTYCVRAERFGDGAWQHLLETGKITSLLRRLKVLRDQLASSAPLEPR